MEGNSINYWILLKLIISFMSICYDSSFLDKKTRYDPVHYLKFWQQWRKIKRLDIKVDGNKKQCWASNMQSVTCKIKRNYIDNTRTRTSPSCVYLRRFLGSACSCKAEGITSLVLFNRHARYEELRSEHWYADNRETKCRVYGDTFFQTYWIGLKM
jgi:hypothetical protein